MNGACMRKEQNKHIVVVIHMQQLKEFKNKSKVDNWHKYVD